MSQLGCAGLRNKLGKQKYGSWSLGKRKAKAMCLADGGGKGKGKARDVLPRGEHAQTDYFLNSHFVWHTCVLK